MKKLSLYIFLVLMFCNTAQALPECEGEDDTQWTNCFGTYLKKDLGDGVTRDYSGEFGNTPGKREGKGKSKVYKDGNPIVEYVGEFKNDRSRGQGTETYADGSKYVGEQKDSKKHGQGTFTYASGDKYVGEWKDDKLHGQGTYTWANGQKYVGGWKDSKKHGQGTFTFADGGKFVGEHKDDARNGQGTYTWANGDKYVGEFKDGKSHGQGTFTYADGDKYVGESIDGKRHGQGTYTWVYGVKYVGEWKNHKKHGQGTETKANGDKYVGEWKDDKLHGQGTYTWVNGDKYVGEWKDDKRHGQGTDTWANGDKYVGEFKDDKSHGQGTDTWVNGDKYVGEHKDGKKHGQGTYTFANGEEHVGEWKDGKLVQKEKSEELERLTSFGWKDLKFGMTKSEIDELNVCTDLFDRTVEGALILREVDDSLYECYDNEDWTVNLKYTNDFELDKIRINLGSYSKEYLTRILKQINSKYTLEYDPCGKELIRDFVWCSGREMELYNLGEREKFAFVFRGGSVVLFVSRRSYGFLDAGGEDYIFLDYNNEVDAEIALENLKPKTLSSDDF